MIRIGSLFVNALLSALATSFIFFLVETSLRLVLERT